MQNFQKTIRHTQGLIELWVKNSQRPYHTVASFFVYLLVFLRKSGKSGVGIEFNIRSGDFDALSSVRFSFRLALLRFDVLILREEDALFNGCIVR